MRASAISRIVLAATAMCFGVAACLGGSQPSPSVTAQLPLRPGARADAEPPMPTLTPNLSHPAPLDVTWFAARAISCGDDFFFAPAVLGQPASDEMATDPAAAALREYLVASSGLEETATRPATGWHRIVLTAVQVQFVAVGTDRKGLWVIGLEARDGAWETILDGACHGQVKRPAGFGPAGWWLDPAFPPPGKQDLVLHVLINEESCASGKSPEGRVGPPEIAYFQQAIVVTLSVRPRSGGQDCPSNPDFAMKIRLNEPVGDRRILDGGLFPPRDAQLPPA